jgi:hypothetical protein
MDHPGAPALKATLVKADRAHDLTIARDDRALAVTIPGNWN